MTGESGPSKSAWVEAFAGAGFGLLLGVIVGLSTTPVVKDVIVVLTGLLAVVLGLKAGGDDNLPVVGSLQSDPMRIGGFGLATAAGLILGVYLRVANPFAEDPDVHAARWVTAFDGNPVLAHQAMLYERFGMTPSAWSFDPGKEAIGATVDAAQAGARRGGLFGALTPADLCDELDPDLASDDPEILLTFYNKPNEPVLLAVAAKVRELPENERLGALVIVRTLFCAMETEEKQAGRGAKK